MDQFEREQRLRDLKQMAMFCAAAFIVIVILLFAVVANT